MQTLVALSMMEPKIIAPSTALQEVITCYKNFKTTIQHSFYQATNQINVAALEAVLKWPNLNTKYIPAQSTFQNDSE